MVFLLIFEAIHSLCAPRAGKIGRIAINNGIGRELAALQELQCIAFHEGSHIREAISPQANDDRIDVDADGRLRRELMPKDRPSTEVGLDISGVRWQQIDDLLVTLSLSPGVPHDQSSSSLPIMSRAHCARHRLPRMPRAERTSLWDRATLEAARRVLPLIGELLRPQWVALAAAAVSMLGSRVAALLPPASTAFLVDTILAHRHLELIPMPVSVQVEFRL